MKDPSDIFICKLKRGRLLGVPEPVRGPRRRNFEIQFRNLTEDAIEIDLGAAPVHKRKLSLAPGEADSVNVNGDARRRAARVQGGGQSEEGRGSKALA